MLRGSALPSEVKLHQAVFGNADMASAVDADIVGVSGLDVARSPLMTADCDAPCAAAATPSEELAPGWLAVRVWLGVPVCANAGAGVVVGPGFGPGKLSSAAVADFEGTLVSSISNRKSSGGQCDDAFVDVAVNIAECRVLHVCTRVASWVLGMGAGYSDRPFELALFEERNRCFRMLEYDASLSELLELFSVGSRLVLRPNSVLLALKFSLQPEEVLTTDLEEMRKAARIAAVSGNVAGFTTKAGTFRTQLLFQEALFNFQLGRYRADSPVEAGQLIALSFLAVNAVKQAGWQKRQQDNNDDEVSASGKGKKQNKQRHQRQPCNEHVWEHGWVNPQQLSGWMDMHEPDSLCGRAALPAVLSQALGSCRELIEWSVGRAELQNMFVCSIQTWCAKVYLGEFLCCNKVHISSIPRAVSVNATGPNTVLSRKSKSSNKHKKFSKKGPHKHWSNSGGSSNLSSSASQLASVFTFDDDASTMSFSSASHPYSHATSRSKNTSTFISPSNTREQRQQQQLHLEQASASSGIRKDLSPRSASQSVFPVTWVSINAEGVHVLFRNRNPTEMVVVSGGLLPSGVMLEEETLLTCTLQDIERWSCSPDGNVFALCLSNSGRVVHLSGISNAWARTLVSLLALHKRLADSNAELSSSSNRSIRGEASLAALRLGSLFHVFGVPLASQLYNDACLGDYCRLVHSFTTHQRGAGTEAKEDQEDLVEMTDDDREEYDSKDEERNDGGQGGQEGGVSDDESMDAALNLDEGGEDEEAENEEVRSFRKQERKLAVRILFKHLSRVQNPRLSMQRALSSWVLWNKREQAIEQLVYDQEQGRAEEANRAERFVQEPLARLVWLHWSAREKRWSSELLSRALASWTLATLRARNTELGQLRAVGCLTKFANRGAWQILGRAFAAWSNFVETKHADVLRHFALRFAQRRELAAQALALRRWRYRSARTIKTRAWLARMINIIEGGRQRLLFRRSWARWVRVMTAAEKRSVKISSVFGRLAKRHSLKRHFRAWWQWRACESLLCGIAQRCKRDVLASLRRHALLSGAIRRMCSWREGSLLGQALRRWADAVHIDNVLSLSDVIERIKRRILLARGLGAWKTFVIVQMVQQGAALTALVSIFESYQDNVRRKRLAGAFGALHANAWLEGGKLFLMLISSISERLLLRRGMNAFKRFVVVRDMEQSFALQRIAEVLSNYEGVHRQIHLERALDRWKAFSRDTIRAMGAEALGQLTENIWWRLQLRRGMDAWKMFVMAQEAEHTYGIHVITSVFAAYMGRDREAALRRSLRQWRTVMLDGDCQLFDRLIVAIHKRLRLRRGLAAWKRFVMQRAMEESFAVGKVLEVFVSYDRRASVSVAFDCWRAESARRVEQVLAERAMEDQRSILANVVNSWRDSTLKKCVARDAAAQTLVAVVEQRRIQRALREWRVHAASQRRKQLLKHLLLCHNSIADLAQACKNDLTVARKVLLTSDIEQ